MGNSKTATLKMTGLNEILASIANPGADDLIPILQQIQNEYGYLPKEVLVEMGKRTGIPASRIFGVTTFYEQFHLEPRGRHTIKCCRGTACHVRGGPKIAEQIKLQLDIEPGETTNDMRFTFETVACLGTCFLAPVVMVDKDYYGHLQPKDIKDILERYS
jgi:NADH-quinone oxidoreductase subunit E